MAELCYENRIRKNEWEVKNAPFQDGKQFITQYHYAKGGSNTYVYMHGLYRKNDPLLMGIAWWLPPTRIACESVNKEQWQKVISLTRLAVHPDVPKNACSFLLAKSIKLIKNDGRFVSLVTYADESQNHIGTIYKASNWQYIGKTGPYQRWVDANGGQVSIKATVSRTVSEMYNLGYVKAGKFHKHKYVKHLNG